MQKDAIHLRWKGIALSVSKKQRLVPLLFLIVLGYSRTCIAFQGESALPDTIYATTSKTTSIVFPSKITIYDIGNEDFGGVKDENLLLLKAAHDSALATSLIVRYNSGIYHGTLAFHENPRKLFLDLSTVTASQATPTAKPGMSSDTMAVTSPDAEKRLLYFLADPESYYKGLAVKNVQEHLALSLLDLRVDQENLYAKLLFINGSKLDYKIEFTEFVYQDPIERKDLKGAYDKKNVYQHATNQVDLIKGREVRLLGYCIPRFTLSKEGELVFIVREKEGSRSVTLPIPFKTILKAKPL